MSFKEFLMSFKPSVDLVPIAEKFRSGLAALGGILFLGVAVHFLPGPGYPLILLASMAAAAVLLYAVPHSPMAQPWPLVGGNLVSALIGWTCSLLIPDPVWAGACAVGTAVLIMYLLHCLHPPGGATAMIMVLNAQQFHQEGIWWAGSVVLANVLFSLLWALAINNLVPNRHYPARRITLPRPPGISCDLKREDIEWALQQIDSMIDVSEDDLISIYQLAAGRARERSGK